MAEKGTPHFIFQRVTALVMIPLTLWFVVSLIAHAGDSRTELMEWIAHWHVAVPLSILLLAGFFHMRLGIEVVIDDYIHKPDTRSMLHFLNTLFALILGAIAVWSVVAITLIV